MLLQNPICDASAQEKPGNMKAGHLHNKRVGLTENLHTQFRNLSMIMNNFDFALWI